MKKEKAFTLVELLVVMAIISLISIGGIIGASYAMKTARDNRKQQNISQLSAMVSAYQTDNMVYPTCTSGGTGACNIGTLVTGSGPLVSYMTDSNFKGEPCKGANAYNCYYYQSDQTNFALCAKLEGTGGNTTSTAGDRCFCYSVGTSTSFTPESLCGNTSLVVKSN